MRNNTRILLIATTLLTMMSCGKEIDENKGQESGSFVKGQQVSITCSSTQTKATGSDSGGGYTFSWSDGDEILVSIGTASSVFTLSSGAGSATATFTGQMPSSGSTFSVQWPKTTPTLAGGTQTYVDGGIDASMIYAKADNCSLGSTISLAPQYSVLRVGLWDDEKTVGKIVVTNMTASPNETYTLNCGDGIELKNTRETAKYFSIIVPQGEYEFSVTAYDNSATPEFFYYTATNSKIKFEAASVKKMALPPAYPGYEDEMPSSVKGTWWAPVNCGYDADEHPYGLLYQWGRKYGQGIDGTASETDPIISIVWTGNNGSEDSNTFYTSGGDTSDMTFKNDWIKAGSNNYWDETGGSNTSHTPIKSLLDPCPVGWRTSTYTEMNALLGGMGSSGVTLIEKDGIKGYCFDGTSSPSNGVFLPAAGLRTFNTGGFDEYGRGIGGRYWTSSVSGSAAYRLRFDKDGVNMSGNHRSYAFSVRCVYDSNDYASAGGFSEVTTW